MRNNAISAERITQCHFPAFMFLFSFAFFSFVMWCAPYSSDDLEFASLNYVNLNGYLTFALEYGNGRLLGNLGAILLSKHRLLNILIKSFIMSSCVILIPEVLNLRSKLDYLLSFLALVAIDPSVFGEACVWTSGFCNYIPPIWISLVILFLIRRCSGCLNPIGKGFVGICIFLLGIAGQLFIEHSSGINVCLSFCFLLIFWKEHRKEQATYSGIWFTGTLIGLALMLLIPKIFYIAENHTDTYRSFNAGSLFAIVFSAAKNAIQLCSHYFGACSIPVCFGAIATVHLTRSRRSEKANHRLYAVSGICGLYLLLSLLLSSADYLGKAGVIQHAIDCIFLLLPLGIWFFALCRMEDKTVRNPILLCLALAVIAMAPLLIVTPIPIRVVYQSYMFTACAALLCFAQLRKTLPENTVRCITQLAASAAVVLALLIGIIFANVHYMAQIRDRHIRKELASGATEVAVFKIPYEYTTWDHVWSLEYAYGVEETANFGQIDHLEWFGHVYQ